MLPPLDGHGREPQVGVVDPAGVPQGLAVSGPALHEALGWRYGRAAALWRPPRLHWREGVQLSHVAPLLALLCDQGPLHVRRAGAAAPRPWTNAPQRRVLLVEGWDHEAEGSGGHWVGITHVGTIRCLLRGDRPLAPPRDPHAAAVAVLASISRVFAVWYAVMPAPRAPEPAPQHQYSRAGGDTHARAWLAVRELVAAAPWGCRSCSTRPGPGVRSLGSPTVEAAVALPPPLPPPPPPNPACSGAQRTRTPTLPPGRRFHSTPIAP